MPEPESLTAPAEIQRRCLNLNRDRERYLIDRDRLQKRLDSVQAALNIAPQVDQALEHLSQQLFDQVIGQLEENLTQALQEDLEQTIRLRAHQTFKHGTACVEFDIERNGNLEDIMKGQGGSVANVLSVGLRLFALATLPEDKHRPFLVLDEQDCWLRPDLVPKLVRIVRSAARAMGLQVVMISHHDEVSFEHYADRIIRLTPQADGVQVEHPDTTLRD